MTSAVSTANRLDNLASIIKAKKEQERAEYDALPEVVIDCAVHGEGSRVRRSAVLWSPSSL